MTNVAAPAVNIWDQAAIVADALAVLRLDAADVDAERIEVAATEATEQIDAELDRVDVLDTTLVVSLHGAAVDLTVSLYRRKDAGTGMAATYTSGGTAAVDVDPLAKVRLMVLPWKKRWGLA